MSFISTKIENRNNMKLKSKRFDLLKASSEEIVSENTQKEYCCYR